MKEQNHSSSEAVKARLPYPANSLGEPKKDFNDTFRLSTAVKKAIEKNK